ncbi:hypothetical protein ACIRL2_11795 [Embleya sp. NPDC127516]|uniref:hypothetical protein n=1 Tax=Embleya sp. NPDC127516 TaxID=3363990 RepID=UPI00382A980F
MNRPSRSKRSFVHPHVASGHSMRSGVPHPHTLIERTVEHCPDTLAPTDRDGVYGAVARGCVAAGIRPVRGAEFAVPPIEPAAAETSPRRRTPARGGEFTDAGHPRAAVLARGRAGRSALCRLISDAHGRDRADPATTRDALAAGHRPPGAGRPVRRVEHRRPPGRTRTGGRVDTHGPAPATRRVLVHTGGFRIRPCADLRPAGGPTEQPPHKLWHAGPGSAG